MNQGIGFSKGKTDTAPLPGESAAPSSSEGSNPAADKQELRSFDGTMRKSLSELEKARFDAALIQPLEKQNEGRGTITLQGPEKTEADAVSLASGKQKNNLAQVYIPCPDRITNKVPKSGLFFWRIELCGLGLGIQPLGFDILDDVIIGRGQQADIDLGPYGASNCGVSRRHAMLRPTTLHLFLIDLGSTNGTYFNSVSLGHATTQPVKHDDVIMLGSLSFAIKIVGNPAEMAERLGDQS